MKGEHEVKTTRTDARERPVTASKIDPAELSAKRRAASAKGVAARWGESRGESRQVRIDAVAAAALETVPEKDRRDVATRGVLESVRDYHAKQPVSN